MGTLVTLCKPFDLSLQNLINFLFGFECALLPKKKKTKGNERTGREKGKNGPDALISLFTLSLLLSSQLMLCLLLDVCEFFVVFFFCCFVFFVCVCGFSFFCHFLLVFNLLFVKINKSIFKK